MAETATISRTNSSFPEYLDFTKLRKEGIEHLENLSTALWTDFNLHDPGITILEVLCYALTDLGYRTNFSIEDILTRSEEKKSQEKTDVFGQPLDDNFFTAAEILSCNPVTINDLRKLLMDIQGVKNAWFELAEEGEIPIFLNPEEEILQYDRPSEISEKKSRLKLKGLYEVCVELDTILRNNACQDAFLSTENILEQIYAVLHQHRNLCEDIRDVVVVGEEKIAICADIELAADADPEEVLLEMYKRLEQFLAPQPRFYTLQEMLEKGKRVEEIFAGRPLNGQSHGFLDLEELTDADNRKVLYTSDVIQEIMDVPGVLAIRKIDLVNYINGQNLTIGETWCLKLTPKYRPHFCLEKSKINFFKGQLPFSIGKDGKELIEQRYLEEKVAATKVVLKPQELNLPIPEGTHRDLADYYSIQNEFPLTYGIGEEGLKTPAPPLRKAQAKQLKAYLLFYDQILANYLAQLTHIRDLFSIREDSHPQRIACNGNHTYFTQLLSEVPGVEELIRNFNACPDDPDYLEVPDDYPDYLNFIVESIQNYKERRNRFLDHLLARFAESFTDYVLLMFELQGKRKSLEGIIQDKADYLQSYPEISRNRGKGFNYREPSSWKIPENEQAPPPLSAINISGLEKRVSKQIGIDQVGRRPLAHGRIVEENDGWRIVLNNPESEERILLGKIIYPGPADAQNALPELLALAREEQNYRQLSYQSNPETFGFLLFNEEQICIAKSAKRYTNIDKRNEAIQHLIHSIRLAHFQCSIYQSEECYFFELYDYLAERLLFRSHQGYLTQEDALAAYRYFLSIGTQLEFYETTEESGGPYGFYLRDEATGVILADHPHYYESERERDDWMLAIVYYLGEFPPQYEIDEEYPGSFRFEARDGEGNVIFVGVNTYDTEAAARSAFQRVLSLARYRAYYRTIDDNTGENPFGFELLDRRGELLAIHPVFYPTECLRDLALDSIVYCATTEEPLSHICPQTGGYIFQLKDADGNILMQSSDTFEDEAAAEQAWLAFMEIGKLEENYQLTELEDNPDKPYTFVLLGETGDTIAFHPNSYALPSERDMALRAVLNYICYTLILVEIDGDPGIYHFILFGAIGESGRILMSSANPYPDRESARRAFLDFLDIARVYENYYILTGGGFELRDAEGTLIAVGGNEDTDETPAELEATIQMILAYLRDDPDQFTIVNTEGAFYPQVFDQVGQVILVGTEIFDTRETASVGLENILEYATQDQSYQPHSDGFGRCRFGFYLTNEYGHIIARHPRNYADAESRDQAMSSVYAYLSCGEYLLDESLRHHQVYFYELSNADDDPIFRSIDNYPNTALASESFASFLIWATDEANYYRHEGDTTGKLSFSLQNPEGQMVAGHLLEYDTEEEREEAIQVALLYIRLAGLDYRIELETDGYRFVLLDEYGNDFLESPDFFPDRWSVVRALSQAGILSGSSDNYRLLDDEHGCIFTFDLGVETGETIAIHSAPPYSAAETRDQILTQYITYVNGLGLSPTFPYEIGTYFFEISDFTGRVLLRSFKEDFADQTAVSDYFRDIFLPIATNEVNYQLSYDNDLCLYSFELQSSEGTIIAIPPHPFASRRERDECIQYLLFLLRCHDIFTSIEGTACGFYFELSHDDLQFRSRLRYPTREQALRACNEVAGLLPETGNVEVVLAETGYELQLLDATGAVVMYQLGGAFESETGALSAWEQIVAWSGEPGDFSSAYFFEPRSFYCQVWDGNNQVLLSSVEGQDYDVFATWPIQYASPGARDEAIERLMEFFANETAYEIEEEMDTATGVISFFIPIDDTIDGAVIFQLKPSALEEITGGFELKNKFRLKLTRKRNYFPIDDKEACLFGFEIIDKAQKDEAFDLAWKKCNDLLEYGQDSGNYQLVSDPNSCLFGFELFTDASILLAEHSEFYDSLLVAGEKIQQVIDQVNCEGMHLVEHLLLRPRNRGVPDAYYFEITDPDYGQLLFKSIISYPSPEAAQEVLEQIFDTFTSFETGNDVEEHFTILPYSDYGTGDDPLYTYEIPEPGQQLNPDCLSLATSGRCFSSIEEIEADVLEIKDLLESETGILFSSTGSEDSPYIKQVYRTAREKEADRLLPIVGDCDDPLALLCPDANDPYSFRATVVLPYWPARFQQPPFRAFIEHSLRKEAPAHVFLRICWVDACQMYDFEQAFKKWLESMATGKDHCASTQTLNALIEILFNLRSIYPEAQLVGCEEDTPGNPVILNQTILGSANSSSDDSE